VDRGRYFEIARGSALECAAIQDVLVVGKALEEAESQNRKTELDRMAAMLSRLGGREYQVREDTSAYGGNPIDPDPDSDAAHAAIHCQVELQSRAGGNALIGRSLYPLLVAAGYRDVRVSPRMVYVDNSKPELVEGFTKNTFTAMIEGVRQAAVEKGIIDAVTFDQGIQDLYRTTEPDGTFCYTFFKGLGKA